MITAAQLARVYGIRVETARSWIPYLQKAFELAEINTPRRACCFLAQIGHESGSLRFVKEIWGPTKQQLRYEGTTLAKRLGNNIPGDGKRYMGRGLLQVTGRHNYRMITQKFRKIYGDSVPDFEADPVQLQTKYWAALSAALFWKEHKLNRWADNGDFAELTRRINGGYNGLAHRQALFIGFLSEIG